MAIVGKTARRPGVVVDGGIDESAVVDGVIDFDEIGLIVGARDAESRSGDFGGGIAVDLVVGGGDADADFAAREFDGAGVVGKEVVGLRDNAEVFVGGGVDVLNESVGVGIDLIVGARARSGEDGIA